MIVGMMVNVDGTGVRSVLSLGDLNPKWGGGLMRCSREYGI